MLGEQNYLNDALPTAPADVLVLPMTEDLAPAIRLATELRAQGIRAQLYAEPKKFKAKLSYCDKLHIPFAILLGEDELKENKVTLKNLTTGEQSTISASDAIGAIKLAIWEAGQGTVIRDHT